MAERNPAAASDFARRLQGDYIGRVLRTYRWDANARQLTFNISREEFEKLIFLDCHYCGRKPSQSVKIGKDYKEWHPTFRYNGIDRVDNLKGYEIGNLVPCCNQCNKARRDTSYNEFLEWARAVSKLHPETMSKGAA